MIFGSAAVAHQAGNMKLHQIGEARGPGGEVCSQTRRSSCGAPSSPPQGSPRVALLQTPGPVLGLPSASPLVPSTTPRERVAMPTIPAHPLLPRALPGPKLPTTPLASSRHRLGLLLLPHVLLLHRWLPVFLPLLLLPQTLTPTCPASLDVVVFPVTPTLLTTAHCAPSRDAGSQRSVLLSTHLPSAAFHLPPSRWSLPSPLVTCHGLSSLARAPALPSSLFTLPAPQTPWASTSWPPYYPWLGSGAVPS